jgi:hypothetical protein
MRPHSSKELLEANPRLPSRMWMIRPFISLITAPKPVGRVFPLDVPSKFNLKKPGDPGGYRWPPTFFDWLKTVFWQFWQFTIFSRF